MARFISSSSSMAMSAVTAAVATALYSTTRCEQQVEEDKFKIEVHLMDKIQQKSYLHSAKEGIPSTLRILAIDLPEMRKNAFSGDCRLSHEKVFVDDIAPPKVISVGNNNTEANSKKKKQSKLKISPKELKLKIPQKALIKSLVHCQSPQSQQKVGVELLEASVADLNRYKLRKTHQIGNFKYDPGKYYGSSKHELTTANGATEDDEIDEVDAAEVLLDKASYEDEMEAPWNQYAWIEELRLRISGQVPFEAPMEKSSRFQRQLFGNVFKVTVPSVRRFWEWPLPKFAKSDPDGVDGRNKTNCRACNKPHAVIANGAALQRVPSSLRLLQKMCRKADVPLFVIHDPRVWGGNTHETLPEALREMRATIKNRVISQALKQQGSSAFTRGRMLGQFETETKWQVKEKKQRAKNLFDGGVKKRRKSEAPKDWSQLDSTLLEKRLVERGVIQKKKEGETDTKRVYTAAMVEIARWCVKDEAEGQKEPNPKSVEQRSELTRQEMQQL